MEEHAEPLVVDGENEESVHQEEVEEIPAEPFETMDALALPIRAKPLFHNNKEEVEEFPLVESKDGANSTSIVVGNGLFRIVETTLHQDGPRIDVQLVMDSEITGFQHIIEKPTSIEFGLSGGFVLAGILLMMIQGLTPIVLGLGLFFVGLKFLPAHLAKHRLIFSSCGNSHEIELSAWNVFTPGFRASMALIGPTMADYMRMGHFDVSEINNLHKQLRSPIVPTIEQPIAPQLTESVAPVEIVPLQTPGVIDATNAPEAVLDANETPMQEMPVPMGPPVSAPVPPEPVPAPLPPPLAPPISPPSPVPPPVVNAAMPAPLPPPIAPLPSSPPGINQPVPLNMPMPEAPRVAVQATPSEEPSISQEEQDALLDELS